MASELIKSESRMLKCNRLLRQIRRQGRAGRLELARLLHISNSRVCELIQQMLGDGLLVEEGGTQERRGRRGVPVMLNPRYGHLVGFDMEAKRLRLVVADFAGRIVWQSQQRLVAPKSRDRLIERILGFIDDGLEEIRPEFGHLLGIGLAANGVIDVQRGVILHYDLVASARDLPLRDLVAGRTGLPCCMEDNIRALTLAEWMSGAAQRLDSFICLAVRSGVGAGIVIDGKLHVGSHGFAGEAGYMPLKIGGNAGQWKHLQRVVSEHAMGIDAERRGFGLTAGRARRAGELLGAQLASMAALLDPQAIVLAGALICPDGPLWHATIRSFRRLALTELADRVQVLPAQLGAYAAAAGATHRCFEMLYPVEPGSS